MVLASKRIISLLVFLSLAIMLSGLASAYLTNYCSNTNIGKMDEDSYKFLDGNIGTYQYRANGDSCSINYAALYNGVAYNDEADSDCAGGVKWRWDRCSQGSDSCYVLEEAYVHGCHNLITDCCDSNEYYRTDCRDFNSGFVCNNGACKLPAIEGASCSENCHCVGGCCDNNKCKLGKDKGCVKAAGATTDECGCGYECTWTHETYQTCSSTETSCKDKPNPDTYCAGINSATPYCKWINDNEWACVGCLADSDCGTDGYDYRCSGNTIQRRLIGHSCTNFVCQTSNGAWSNYAACTGGENSRCINGLSSCQTKCSDGLDNDGDTFIDTQDSDCGGCGLCNGGSCCTATGCYISAGTSCRASAGVCDVAEVCSGTSGACPADAKLSGKQSCSECTQCNGVSNVCVNIAVNTDPYNQCVPGVTNCVTTCRIRTSGAGCNGAGACDSSTVNIAAGRVCSAGAVADATTESRACDGDTNYNCAAGSCSGNYRYSECNGAGACDNAATTYYEHTNVDAAVNKVLTTTCTNRDAISQALACDGNTNNFCTAGSCTGYYRYSECRGTGTCDDAATTNYEQTDVGPNPYHNLTTSCTWVAIPPGSLEFNCKDGIDNNCDGQIDECRENNYPKCINVTDDDSDGAADFPAEIDCRGRLNGTIFEAENPSAIVEGATVKGIPAGLSSQFQSSSNVSDFQGRYNVSALVGTYTFVASKKDYIDEIKTITIGSGQNTTINFNLRKGKNCHTDCTDSNGICSPACQGFSQGGDTCVLLKDCEYRQKDYIAMVTDGTTTTTYTCCEETTNTYKTMTPKITGDVETLYDYVFPAKINGVTPVKVHILYWEPK
ncbi:MAG: MopE-related protein [archaeon]